MKYGHFGIRLSINVFPGEFIKILVNRFDVRGVQFTGKNLPDETSGRIRFFLFQLQRFISDFFRFLSRHDGLTLSLPISDRTQPTAFSLFQGPILVRLKYSTCFSNFFVPLFHGRFQPLTFFLAAPWVIDLKFRTVGITVHTKSTRSASTIGNRHDRIIAVFRPRSLRTEENFESKPFIEGPRQ